MAALLAAMAPRPVPGQDHFMKPRSSVYLPARSIGPILAACMGMLVLLALGSEAAIWVIGLWLTATTLGLYGAWRQHPVWFSGIQRLSGGLLFLLLAFLLSGWGNWLSIASQSVLVLLAVKALEMRSQRDFYQVAALVLLGMGVAAWLRVDVLLGIYLLLTLYLAVLGLLWQPLADAAAERGSVALNGHDFRYMLIFSMVFLCLLIPLTGLFFLLLPRTPTPLWAWAPPQGSARSGFSADLSPDQIRRLALDPAIAFRAQINFLPAHSSALYWVGAILWKDMGNTWVADPPILRTDLHKPGFTVHPLLAKQPIRPLLRQEIVLSPGDSDYLFALSFPRRWQIPLAFHAQQDGVMQLQKAPALPLRYTVWSGSRPRGNLSNAERQAALQVPAQTSPALRKLAASLAGNKPEATVGRLMQWFRGPSFHYSLKAPAAYPHGQSIGDFLLHSHTGFCAYYAGGLALLLRLDGVPARVITGYHGGEYNPLGNYWLVRQSMAHAWVQAWLPKVGWVRLDATPAAAVGGAVDAGGKTSVNEVPAAWQLWDWMQWEWMNAVINLTPAKQRAIWTSAGLRFLHFIHSVQSAGQKPLHWPRLPPLKPNGKFWSGWLMLIPIWLLLFVVFRYWRKRHHFRQNADGYWREQAIRALRELGSKDPRPGHESALWAGLTGAQEIRSKIVQGYYAQRYGPHPTAAGNTELLETIDQLRSSRN